MSGIHDPYEQFLCAKAKLAPMSGFAIDDGEVNPILKPHQRDIVRWAVAGGRRALFCAFGLGKTFMQLEIIRLMLKHNGGGRGLIVLPLGVRQEFKRDAHVLRTGDHPAVSDAQRAELAAWCAQGNLPLADLPFIRTIEEAGHYGVYLTNYETVRDGKLDPKAFDAITLDEGSVLRSFGSKTYQTFLDICADVPFRFVATATPSPNRYKELIHYAGYLGIMDTGQALTRFFKRDSSKAGNLQLYPHKEKEFWLWLSSWAVFLQKPSDLGHSDEGYDLPPMKVFYHEVKTDLTTDATERDGQHLLIRNPAMSLSDAAAEKRSTLEARVAKAAEIVASSPDDHFILWHDLEDERHALTRAIPGAVAIYGAQDLDKREQVVVDFSQGRIQHLAAKPVIAGSGCNFQRFCHKAIFCGIGFKFNDFIQSIHRIYRFLQAQRVEIHIIYSETETHVLRDLQAKWTRHKEMTDAMSDLIKKHGLNSLSMKDAMTRSLGIERVEVSGERFRVANNDCVLEAREAADDSVDLIVTSIPFSNHYEYTPSYNDFGHTDDDSHFFEQMDYLTPELLRVLKPGRVACIHVKDRILFGNVTGAGCPTVNPFHMKTAFHYMSHGFAYMGMIHVNTDVVRENNQTYRLGWTEQCKDGTKMGVGCPEYILLMRKLPSDRSKAYADEPVRKEKASYTRARWQIDAHGFWRSSGNRMITPDELMALQPDQLARLFTEWSRANVYDYEAHVRIGEALEGRGALPSSFMAIAPGATAGDTWDDVNRMLTLNTSQSAKRQEQHVCPLQFDIVDRLIDRYSNEGDLVFDPFGGLMTVPYRALLKGRRGQASELNPQYFLDGVKYLQAAERDVTSPNLFDLLDAAHGKAAVA